MTGNDAPSVDLKDDLEVIHQVDLASVAPQVAAVVAAVEAHGWTLQAAQAARLRYWCSCQRRHQTWIELNPKDPADYQTRVIELLSRKTCWEEGSQ